MYRLCRDIRPPGSQIFVGRRNNPHNAARALLEWAQATWPEHPPTNLAELAERAGNDREPLLALDRALSLDPELAVAWYNRGLMHFHAHRWQEALNDLEEAAALADDNLKMVGYGLGLNLEGREQFLKFMQV